MPTEAQIKEAQEAVRKNQEESKRINEQWNQTVADVNKRTEDRIADGSYISREEAALIDKQEKAEQEKILSLENTQRVPDADQAIRDKYLNDFRKGELEAVDTANAIGDAFARGTCSVTTACGFYEIITGNVGSSTTGEKLTPGERFIPVKGPFKSFKKKPKTENVATSKLPIRTVENSLEKVSEIRKSLSIGQKRNIAFAEFNFGGKTGGLIGVSGKADRPGTVGIPKKRRFETIKTGNNPRTLDSEVKILENLAAQLPPNAKGTVNLFSELPLCISCSNVVPQFKKAFPNVILNVSSGPAR